MDDKINPGEIVYVFTDERENRLQISEKCCELIGGTPVREKESTSDGSGAVIDRLVYKNCDACFNYAPSNGEPTLLVPQGADEIIKTNPKVIQAGGLLSICCEKKGYYYYDGWAMGVPNRLTAEQQYSCWTCPLYDELQRDGINFTVGTVIGTKTITDIKTSDQILKEQDTYVNQLEKDYSSCLSQLKSAELDPESPEYAVQKAECDELRREYEIAKDIYRQLIGQIGDSPVTYTVSFDDGTTTTFNSTTYIEYIEAGTETPLSKPCCDRLASLLSDSEITYIRDGDINKCVKYKTEESSGEPVGTFSFALY
jgi:hypothetical protein